MRQLFNFSIIIVLLKLIWSQRIDDIIISVENDLIQIRDAYEARFKTRCSDSAECSYHTCADNAPEGRTCNLNFKTTDCLKCWDPAGFLVTPNMSVKLADVYYPKVSENNQQVKELVKTGAGINTTYQSLAAKNPLFYKWQYVGTSNGAYLIYPGLLMCTKYDPRYRPWYVGASTGAKNFILVLDFSGSMQNEYREESLKASVKLLIGTLVNADWVGVVTFSTDAKQYNPTLIRATSENKEKIISYIMNFSSSGGTNFSDAFQKTNDMIQNTVADENGSPCKTFVMFLTDGTPTSGITDQVPLLKFIDDLPHLKKATIFAYSIGTSADRVIPKAIACMRSGIFEYIQDADQLSEKMNSYYVTLSLGLDINKALWVEPYIDSMGLGEMTTCSIPIYDRSVTPYRLLGVAGIDIIIGDLYKLEPNKDTVKNKLLRKSMSSCSASLLTECQINSLRGDDAKCTIADNSCTPIVTSFTTCPSSISNVFCNTLKEFGFTPTDSTNSTLVNGIETCCGSEFCKTGGIVGGIIGAVIGLFIIIFIPVYFKVIKPANDAKANNVEVNVNASQTHPEQNRSEVLSSSNNLNTNVQMVGGYVNPNSNINPNSNVIPNADLNINAEYNFSGYGGNNAPIGPAA